MKDTFARLLKNIGRDKWILMSCLALAFISWQGIKKNTGFEVLVADIPVTVEAPDGWAVSEKSVDQVHILFRGSREDIRYLNSNQLRVVIPIRSPNLEIPVDIRITDQYLINPTGAEVVRISPPELMVRMDRKIEKQVPVKAAYEQTLQDGLELARIQFNPATVEVSGAKLVLDEMNMIYTEPFLLKSRPGTFKQTVPIAVPEVGRVEVTPSWVNIEYELMERSESIEFTNVPVQVISRPEDTRQITVIPTQIALKIKGAPERVDQLSSSSIVCYVNCTDLKENAAYDLPIQVDLPAGLQLMDCQPNVIKVNIR